MMTTTRSLTSIGLVAVLALSMTTSAARGDAAIDLRTAEGFAVLAGTTITNVGATAIDGDIGIHPGSTAPPNITGYGPGADAIEHDGTLYDVDVAGVAAQATADLASAYAAVAASTGAASIERELSTAVLAAGVYASHGDGDFLLSAGGTLTLDGGPDDVWMFLSTSTLTFGADTQVLLIGGAEARNVFWQVETGATIAADAEIVGTIMALTSITLALNATLDGRALAGTSVTLASNTITVPAPGPTDAFDSGTQDVTITVEAVPRVITMDGTVAFSVDAGLVGIAAQTGTSTLEFSNPAPHADAVISVSPTGGADLGHLVLGVSHVAEDPEPDGHESMTWTGPADVSWSGQDEDTHDMWTVGNLASTLRTITWSLTGSATRTVGGEIVPLAAGDISVTFIFTIADGDPAGG